MFKKWWVLGLSAIYLSTIHAQQADNATERPLIIYKVQAGDTLSQLSARFFVETANLVDVRTPLSVTGVRGTEFRVGYAPTEQVGQVEVVRGIVAATGISDSQSQPVSKGQGLPFDRSGKAMAIENLLDAPVFERAEATHATPPTHAIKLAPNPSAKHYVVLNTKSANLLGEQISQTITTAEVLATNLNQDAVFYQFASVSPSGLIGPSRQYGFCTVAGDIKFGRCRARFDAPLADGALITFSLIKHALGTTQELVSTQKLQARNGRFVIEGLPAGHYTWNMSYQTSSPGNTNHDSKLTKQSGYFDLIALKTNLP